jgi:non-canonical (house-cleaning) NTP pyrophosphatase
VSKNDEVSIGNSSIIDKALERAKRALGTSDAAFAVGFAEGVIEISSIYYTSAWCAIVDKLGNQHLGGGLHIRLSGILLDKLVKSTLSEKDVETYLQSKFSNPFERLVEYATLHIRDSFTDSTNDVQ